MRLCMYKYPPLYEGVTLPRKPPIKWILVKQAIKCMENRGLCSMGTQVSVKRDVKPMYYWGSREMGEGGQQTNFKGRGGRGGDLHPFMGTPQGPDPLNPRDWWQKVAKPWAVQTTDFKLSILGWQHTEDKYTQGPTTLQYPATYTHACTYMCTHTHAHTYIFAGIYISHNAYENRQGSTCWPTPPPKTKVIGRGKTANRSQIVWTGLPPLPPTQTEGLGNHNIHVKIFIYFFFRSAKLPSYHNVLCFQLRLVRYLFTWNILLSVVKYLK